MKRNELPPEIEDLEAWRSAILAELDSIIAGKRYQSFDGTKKGEKRFKLVDPKAAKKLKKAIESADPKSPKSPKS